MAKSFGEPEPNMGLGLAVLILLFIQVRPALARINQCGDYVDLSNEPLGAISSPGYPENYTNNMNCIWLIQAPSQHAVSLYIYPVSGEGGDTGYINVTDCNDYLEVRAGSSSSDLLFRSCNTSDIVHITSPGRWMWVQFKSDETNNQGKGFTAIFARTKTNVTGLASPVEICQTINFMCRNKECVSRSYRCDSLNDCGCTGTGCDEADCGGLNYTKEVRVAIGVGIGTFIFFAVFLIIGLIDLLIKARQMAENARLMEQEKNRGRRRRPAAIAMTVQAAATSINNCNPNVIMEEEVQTAETKS